jgi:hypothetical protein
MKALIPWNPLVTSQMSQSTSQKLFPEISGI